MEYFNIENLINDKIKKILRTNDIFLNEEKKFKKKIYKPILEECDKKMPKEIGDMLVNENNNPNYVILIHRTAKATKEDLFKNGLIIAGGNDLDYTTSRYENDNITLILSVIEACGYKNKYSKDSRCVIMKIPKTALEYSKGKTKPILYQTNNIAEQSGGMAVVPGKYQTVLLPEYILGTVEFKDDKITGFSNNPNYTDIHDYKNDGLVCPSETLNSFKKQNNLDSNVSDEYINNVISKENIDYMNYINYAQAQPTSRTEESITDYSQSQNITVSIINKLIKQIRNYFTNIIEKDKGEEKNNVDR